MWVMTTNLCILEMKWIYSADVKVSGEQLKDIVVHLDINCEVREK